MKRAIACVVALGVGGLLWVGCQKSEPVTIPTPKTGITVPVKPPPPPPPPPPAPTVPPAGEEKAGGQ